MRKWNTTFVFSTQLENWPTSQNNRNNQPASRQCTTPECKVRHWIFAFCLALVMPQHFCMQYTAKQLSIAKQSLHDDVEVVLLSVSSHSRTGYRTEITSPNRNSQPTLMQHTTAWYKYQTLFFHSAQSKTGFRTVTTTQNGNNHPVLTQCTKRWRGVKHCFYIQYTTPHVSEPKNQPVSKQPAGIEATHSNIVQILLSHSVHRQPGCRTETTSQNQNNRAH